jgi:hypothetical protein
LRLRREKIHAAAKDVSGNAVCFASGVPADEQSSRRQSLEEFAIELTETLRQTLTSYVDCLAATSATNVQLSEHARDAVESIDVERDCKLCFDIAADKRLAFTLGLHLQ